ncbi:MAG: chitobiase/beta-hexosaminidase C-terminal domain-containing protein, partial [Candidatus Faecousia sp.]|nr:chitobiase/beta-hexosaminidase C-terminal domain-containing protein [Candidatus Faecousia sp.]
MNRSIHSKFLAFLLALVMVFSMLPVSALAAEETATWSKVDLKDIKPEDTIAITMTTTDGTTYVLDNSKGTSSAPTAVMGTVSDDTLTITTESSDSLAWNIVPHVDSEGSQDGYVLYKGGTTEEWLYSTNANNGVRVGTNANNIWVVDEASGYLKHVATSRYLGVYTTNPDWRAYTNTTGNTKDQTLGFWKLESSTEPEKETVATPTASPAPGAVEAGTEVTFSCATEGAVIQYHTGDGEWITASKAVVNAATTFTVKATKDGMNDSAEATFAYTIQTEEASTVSIAEALAGEEGTSFTVKGVVTCVDGQNIYVQDSTGGICVRMSAKPTDISLGDTIIGTGSKTVYRGMAQLGDGTYEKSSGLTLT